MCWAIAVLAILSVVGFCFYRQANAELLAVRSMLILAVLDESSCRSYRALITGYFKRIQGNNALEVSTRLILEIDEVAMKLSKIVPGSTLLASNAVAWDVYNKLKSEQ